VRVVGLRRLWWRFLVGPLVVWLVFAAAGTVGLLWSQYASRDGVASRFGLRVGLMGDFVTSYVADLIDRQRVQATAFLSAPLVDEQEFARTVAGFGYPAAVLLDDQGRVLRAAPPDPSITGQDLTGRYEHLRTAVAQGQPAVSPVVASAVLGVPVVAFAVPFDTGSGRRVFSGAVEVTRSQLSSYLSTALSLRGVRVQLVDTSGAVLAANRPVDPAALSLSRNDPALAGALRHRPHGRYLRDGQPWRYFSRPIAGTPWRLSATVADEVLFASVADTELAGRVALGTAAAVGLLVVAAAARAGRSRRELRLSEQRFRKVFDNSRIGMVLTDPDGRLVRVNPAVCQILGRPAEDLLNRHLADVCHPDDADAGTAEQQDCLAGRIDGFDLDKRYRHADGSTVEAAVTTALLRDDSDRPQAFTTQIIDMTERRTLERARQRNEAELAARADELQRANTQMADFIAMLSHDVRQPLTGVITAGEMLLDDWARLDENDKHRYVRKMTAAGHRAANLVGDILTLAQFDAGALTARPVHVDIAHSVREAVRTHRHDQPIAVIAPDQIVAFADPVQLQLILGNLIGNAVKYGAAPITLTVTNDWDHVRVQVSDNGDGVPPEFVPHLFDRFTRAGTGAAASKPGSGLGLYLVRQLAEACGATVTYRTNLPRGATFTLTLSRTPPPARPQQSSDAVGPADLVGPPART
jgi:PAS domain S-box-containing protein